MKAQYDSDLQNNRVREVVFEFLENGCGEFSVVFSELLENIDVELYDRVSIYLMHTEQPWFSGMVTSAPRISTDRSNVEFAGTGYAETLKNILVTETYTDVALETVVVDLLLNYLPRTIEWFPDAIMSPGYRVTQVVFDRVPLNEVLDTLAELAENFVWGVDERVRFFWKKAEGKPLSRYSEEASYWLGKDVQEFNLDVEVGEIVNSLSVKIGTINDTDDTNFADFTVERLDSIAFFDKREGVETAPELKDQTEAEVWAGYMVDKSAWPEITGRVDGIDVTTKMTDVSKMLRADGFLRVSLAKTNLLPPFWEPINGYFRWKDPDGPSKAAIGITGIYAAKRVKRSFTARAGGRFGRIRIYGRKVGRPGLFTCQLYLDDTTLVSTKTILQTTVPDWYGKITFEFDDVILYPDRSYTFRLMALLGDSSNYYEVCWQSVDDPYSGAYYYQDTILGGYVEDTTKGLIYWAELAHKNEIILGRKKVEYKVTPEKISASIDLGKVDKPLEQVVLDLLRRMKQEEMLQQSNVTELSVA